MQGCGADIKPRHVGADGRFKVGPLEVVEGFGRELAQAVLTVLAGALTPVGDDITARGGTLELPLEELPSREELAARTADESWQGDQALRLLKALDTGWQPARSHLHSEQVVRAGSPFTLIFRIIDTAAGRSERAPLVP